MHSELFPLLETRRDELTKIQPGAAHWEEVVQWHTRTQQIVAAMFPSATLKQFVALASVRWSFSMRVGSMGGATREQQAFNESARAADNAANDQIADSQRAKMLALLDGLIEIEKAKSPRQPARAPASVPSQDERTGRRVFIVHGHDDTLKAEVARLLEGQGLEPIILHEQPNLGRTIIEKFEACSDVAYAVLLFTPDDMAFESGSKPRTAKPRARQNVAVELGFFAAKLGRGKVFCLKKGVDLELPSDITGVVYTPWDQAGHWKYDLLKELQACGFNVDRNLVK